MGMGERSGMTERLMLHCPIPICIGPGSYKRMANSGIQWIDYTFNLAVRWLYACADVLGITYEEINVWLFCIAWPLTSIAMIIWVLVLRHKIRALRRVLDYQ